MIEINVKTKKGSVNIKTDHRFLSHIDLKQFVCDSISNAIVKLKYYE